MMKKSKTFPKEDLRQLTYSSKEFDGYKLVYSNIVDTTRWSNIYEMVFKHNDNYYKVSYSEGATECQEESPFEYEPDMVDCIQVYPREKTVIVYEPI